MSIIYGTPADLATWVDPDTVPAPAIPKATVLLRAATQLVLSYTQAARYATDAEGKATDENVADALLSATLEQAAAWHLNDIDPRLGSAQTKRRVASKSLNGASVSYVADPKADNYLSDLASGQALTLTAWRFLDNAGLIVTTVGTAPNIPEVFNIAQRAYDPLTGDLEPEPQP